MNILEAITGIFKPAAELVDNLHTSEEEKLNAKAKLTKLYIDYIGKALDFETAQTEARAKIIIAEASASGGFFGGLTKAWRPITMLVFLAMLVAWWFGLVDTPENATEDVLVEIFSLLKLGIGGYIGSRGVEKISEKVLTAFKKPEKV